MLSLESVDRPPVHSLVTFRTNVSVATVEAEGAVIPRMIVRISQVV